MMAPDRWHERIVMDRNIHHGSPVIRGTRVTVGVIVGSIAAGDSVETILASYPQLVREDVQAALELAAEAVSQVDFVPATGGE